MTNTYYVVGNGTKVNTLAEARALSEKTGCGYKMCYEPVKATMGRDEKQLKAIYENLADHGTILFKN